MNNAAMNFGIQLSLLFFPAVSCQRNFILQDVNKSYLKQGEQDGRLLTSLYSSSN
jgi:hypothetical protein